MCICVEEAKRYRVDLAIEKNIVNIKNCTVL